MIKNPITLAVATLALLAGIVMTALSPVSASSAYPTSAGYFPDGFVNSAKEIEPELDTHGDTGLPRAFPKEPVDSPMDSTPEMYS